MKLIYIIFEILIILMMYKFVILFYNNNNLLNFLILIEFISLMILLNMIILNFSSWMFLLYLIYSVSEAIMGLSLLVSMNYMFGHQKIKLINLI